jgi:hypothetical protein
MEVKIGVVHVSRELIFDSAQTPDEIRKTVAEALKAGGLLSLDDSRGRVIVVPVDKLAYVDIGEGADRRVGFGAL